MAQGLINSYFGGIGASAGSGSALKTSKALTEAELEHAISGYTINHKKLPETIYCNFDTGLKIANFSYFIERADTGPAYWTPFGAIPIKLEPQAVDILFESYEDMKNASR